MNIISCGEEHFEELIAFVTRLNDDGRHHIGFFGVGETDIRASLAECVIPPAEGFLLAYEHGKLAGILGVDANPEIGRVWLFGPMIEHDNWPNIADDLYAAVNQLIPAGSRELELFCDARHVNLDEFAERQGFYLRSQTEIYNLLRKAYLPNQSKTNLKDVEIENFQNEYFEQFESLHDKIFPKTYLTAKQIVEKRNERRRLLIAVKDGRLLGYHFCKVEEGLGYIDFIGTDPSARRLGIGSGVLAAGVDWLFSFPAVNNVSLTVHDNNESAQALYKKAGFAAERRMRGYRRDIL